MTDTYVSNGGVGFLGLLALIFITLKLLDKIDWSWIWILSPLWLPLAIFFIVVIIIIIFAFIISLIER